MNELNDQKIEIATLKEREKHHQLQIQEKDRQLEQSDKRESALQAMIESLPKRP